MLDVEDPLSLAWRVKTVTSKNLPHSPHVLCFLLYLLSCLLIPSSLFLLRRAGFNDSGGLNGSRGKQRKQPSENNPRVLI